MTAMMVAGLVWGVFWIPLRALDEAGISGVWAVVVFYALPSMLLMPLIILRRHRLIRGGIRLHLAALLAGTALVLYSGSLIFTEVVRALLFFYITPIWSSLLARIVLAERITPERWATIGLASVGLATILRLDQGFDIALNLGDWMGLGSGVIWAFAAVTLRSGPSDQGIDYTILYFLWGSIAAFALALLPSTGSGVAFSLDGLFAVLPWIIPVMLFLVIPSSFVIMWGAAIISPGLVPLLFMTEISAGTITAGLWANEPFGSREIAGVVLITAAGIFEPLRGLIQERRSGTGRKA